MSAANKIQPLADRVVVKALEEAEQMRGGLYIPDTAKEKPQEGEIVAVGPGKLSDEGNRIPMDVASGDRRAVREVQRHRGHGRWGSVPDSPGIGHSGHRQPLTRPGAPAGALREHNQETSENGSEGTGL